MIRAQLHSRPLICVIAVAVSVTALHDVTASPREAGIAGDAGSDLEITEQAEFRGGRAKPEASHRDDFARRMAQTSNTADRARLTG